MSIYDLIVIGQGYAGLSAAEIARQKGLKVANFEAVFAGGFVMNVGHLMPAPEGAETGSDLISALAMSNMDNGVETFDAPVDAISKGVEGHWTVTSALGAFTSRKIVLATGCRPAKLGVPGEDAYFGRGVSECADCDGPMLAGKSVVVVGSGDSAFQEAITLSMFETQVHLLMRGTAPKARPEFVSLVAQTPNITVHAQTEVIEIVGNDAGVTGVRVQKDGAQDTLDCYAVFAFIGGVPVTDALPKDVTLDARGGVVVDASCASSTDGLYAIGSVRSGFGGLLTDARADAERALEACA